MIGLGLRITSGAVRNALPGIAVPALTLTGGTIDAPLLPQLNTGAFTLENGAVDTHASTDWQIAADAAFTTIVWSALGSLSLTQITVGLALNETTVYYARARHNGATYQSKYSAAVMFNTLSVSVTTPAITSPLAAATGIAETPAITSSAFAVTNGSDTHASTDWQIASDAGFATIVAQSLADATNLESWTVPAGLLLVSSGYFVRVRHTGTAQGASAWSPGISFTTAAAFVNTWDISTASYGNKSFSAAAQSSQSRDVAFSSDGTRMYVVDDVAGTGTIYQYSLSTAWDVSTTIYANKSFSVTSQDSNPQSLEFNSDGTKMYVVGINTDTVYQYTLTTAWDVSTAGYASKSFSVATQETIPLGLSFNSTGTKMYVIGAINDTVYQYTLTTAWDVSTAGYASKSFSVATQGTVITGVSFSSDGFKMFAISNGSDVVFQYNLSTSGDVSTAVYNNISFSVAAQETIAQDILFSSDGTKMYIIGFSSGVIFQYLI